MDQLRWEGGVGFVEGRELAASIGYYSEDLGVSDCGFLDIEGYPRNVCWKEVSASSSKIVK